jgi:hypothetical protein
LQSSIELKYPSTEKKNKPYYLFGIIGILLLVILCGGSSTALYFVKDDPRVRQFLRIYTPTPTPIPSEPFITEELTPMIIEFRNLDDVAEMTSRDSLSPVISNMSTQNTKLKILQSSGKVPTCANEGLNQIATGEDGIIEGYQVFSSMSCAFTDAGCDTQDAYALSLLKAGRLLFESGFTQVKDDCQGK